MKKWLRGLGWALGCLLLGLIVAAIWAKKPALPTVAPPAADAFDASLIERGQKLAAAGYCVSCHTAPGGQPLAGGLAMATDFGTIYSTNITPDVETGIGAWSREAFTRALHEGLARDGSHLFPVFPYDRFTKLANDDVDALYAFLMTRPPVQRAATPNEMPFPLHVRLLQAGWKLLFFKEGRYQSDARQSAEWNRGAYLAEGISHCASCHTPRNALGAERRGDDARYSGAFVDAWFAPALNATNTAPVPWSSTELHRYLRTGGTPYHGVAAGPMAHVVHDGMAQIDDPDVQAIASYFASLNGSATSPVKVDEVVTAALAKSRFTEAQSLERGAQLYTAACAACHYNALSGPLTLRPELGLTSALNAADPNNLVRVILHGVSLGDGLPDAMMPAFGSALSDNEISAIVNYLRKSRTDRPAWHNVPALVAQQRQSLIQQESP